MRSPEVEAVVLDPVADALEAFRRGNIVIVADDPDREDEGDFIAAAELVTDEAVNFILTHGRGLLCVAVNSEIADQLALPALPIAGNDPHGTAFTVSVDLDVPGSTGISAGDRASTIRGLSSCDAVASHFRRPGHVFPLRGRDGGLAARRGHTEAAVELTRLTGLRPAAAICEILNPDGTMARRGDLRRLANRFALPLVSIAALAECAARGTGLRRAATATLPTHVGRFTLHVYDNGAGTEHLALVYGNPAASTAPLIRVHSECLTGDTFGSVRCDCGEQLKASMQRIAAAGHGVVVYVRDHEGRGIGLTDKIRAYALQDSDGLDTIDANLALGLPVDGRKWEVAAAILHDLGVVKVRLLTNNPAKREGLVRNGIGVVEQIALEEGLCPENARYLETKRKRLHHALGVPRPEVTGMPLQLARASE
jgi:3,4-dihydroxy 2-butanone 4-phosphate synthase/GTP cyclohydrolase II